MLNVIASWTNIVWCFLLALFYLVARRYVSMTDKEHNDLKKKWSGINNFASPTIVVVVWLVLRCLYALGLLLLLELILVICTASYIYRKEKQRQSMENYHVQSLLQNPEKLKNILGRNIPLWLQNPKVSSARWLNEMIAGLWGFIALATESSILKIAEPILEANRPSIIHGFALRRCFLGSQPIVITGIGYHFLNEKESSVDIAISWDSDMEVHLQVKIPGPDMHVYIRRLQLEMEIRLTFSPHIPQWPCFANVSLSIMKLTTLNFDISAVGVPLDAMPPVGEFLDNFIRRTLVGMLMYPKRLVIPVLEGYKVSTDRSEVAIGTLRVHLLRVVDWHQRYLSGREKTPFYIKLVMLSEEKKKRMKSMTYKGLQSKLNDVFSFVLYDLKSTLRFWVYFDVRGADICVGVSDIPVQRLIDNKLPEYSCPLKKSLELGSMPRATLVISIEFLRYNMKKTSESNMAPRHTPSRVVSSAFLQQKASISGNLDLPSQRSCKGNSLVSDSPTGGTIFVTIKRCTGLKNMEHFGVSDPYVQLTLRNQTRKSPYVKSTLDPTFNFEVDFDVYNLDEDVLHVFVMDKNDLGKDSFMGKVDIYVACVSSSADNFISGEWNLDPQGKVFITMRLLCH